MNGITSMMIVQAALPAVLRSVTAEDVDHRPRLQDEEQDDDDAEDDPHAETLTGRADVAFTLAGMNLRGAARTDGPRSDGQRVTTTVSR